MSLVVSNLKCPHSQHGKSQALFRARRRLLALRSLAKSGETTSRDGGRFVTSPSPSARKYCLASKGFAKLDLATLSRLGWSQARRHDDEQKAQPKAITPPAFDLPAGDSGNGEAPGRTLSLQSEPGDKCYKLTKVEFRRLAEQVRDVGLSLKNKFRTSPVEKLYRLTPVLAPSPSIQKLHDELQASRLPFQPRQWRQLDAPEQTFVRCRPVSGRPATAHVHDTSSFSGDATSCTPLPPRAVSLQGGPVPHPALQHRFPRPPSAPRPDTPLVTPGHYDTLTPRVLSQLLADDHRPPSAAYGDRHVTRAEGRRFVRDKVPLLSSDELSTTSGIDSDAGDGEDDEDSNAGDKKTPQDSNVADEDEEGDSSDSDEGGFEPSLDEARRQMPSAQSVFQLRPERLDALHVPQDKRDMRRFDFDAHSVDFPPYEFKCPLPEPLEDINLRSCARDSTDWRQQATSAPVNTLPPAVVGMMDRLMELEKYQLVTEEWEARKLRQQNKRLQSASTAGGNNRATSARVRDRRCCGMCVQAACVGDCPEKHLSGSLGGRCDKCLQLLCMGSCQDTKYEHRMRQSGSGFLDLTDRPPPPPPRTPSRGCHSCLRRHTAKLINANNLLLGRPKSSHSTYSRGKASVRPPDLRPVSAASVSANLTKDFDRMAMEAQEAVSPGKRPSSRLRSQHGRAPGKSSRFSQWDSLAETSSSRRSKSALGKARTSRPNS